MNQAYIKTIVALALAEDMGRGDITTNSLIPASLETQARIIFKSAGIVCGLNVAQCVFKTLSRRVKFQKTVADGSRVKKGKFIAFIKGPARAILIGERVALNFLIHLSAIATHTRALVESIKPYKTKILDTRKTTPLLRSLERYAVRTGGGHNHRFDLSTMAMIKDNHLKTFGNDRLVKAVQAIKAKTKKLVELEVGTLREFQQALNSKADMILLDNMTPAQVRRAVIWRNQVKSRILLEVSGGINLDNVRAYAATGVERISIGSLRTSRQVLDISLNFYDEIH
ncbi:MAG: carboxylating nicotinate-nucleotide diphosphorylase [Candidatus Omnitrophica bacterium]|nr:carboxylating nicotinate-nucleotide diphosphorylase [Candidatus Omnitrophota bacterium]